MRFVVDLQTCQTETSAGRGVGRYAQTLAMHMALQCGNNDLRLCFNKLYPSELKRAIDVFETHLPRQHLSAYAYPFVAAHGDESRNRSVAIAQALVQRHWMSLQPDVLHISHLFEGFHGQAVSPKALPSIPGLLRSATLYDLIPLRFPDLYLRDPAYRSWYMQQLSVLKELDHVLAISASTRSDATELAGVDPERITVIGGAVDPLFRRQRLSETSERTIRARYRLKSRVVLYVGGDDPRKNLDGAVQGYAALPSNLRRDTQLAIVCALSEVTTHRLLETARKSELGPEDVVLTGYVPDSDLVALYNLCDAFVFPSLYEGLGLPVLEAMSCGAPVLGSNNSGVAEIIGRSDAMFDARRPDSMAERVAQLLRDDAFREALRRHGVDRSREFTWERCASIAMAALQESHCRVQRPARDRAEALPRRRLAVFTPLPPARTGVADYSATLLPFLARYFDIDLFVEDGDARPPDGLRTHSHRQFATMRSDFHAIVYEMGNSEFHAYMLEYMSRYPGVMVLHDAYLSGLYGHVDFNLGRAGAYVHESLHSHGPRARRYLAQVQDNPDPVGAAMLNLPMSKTAIESAIGVISHTGFNVDVMKREYPEGIATPYRIIKQIVRPPSPVDGSRRRLARVELGFRDDDFVVCTFGHITWTKCGDILLDAFSVSELSRDPRTRLAFVGELSRDDFGYRLRSAIDASTFKERVTITGFVDSPTYEHYLAAADLAVQLRAQTRGGTSKAILDCLACGLPVIANETGSFTDYPDEAIQKTAPIPNVAELGAKLTLLYRQRERLPALSTAALDYVAREHDPQRIAAEHAMAIDEFIRRSALVSLPGTLREIGDILGHDPVHHDIVRSAAVALHKNLNQPLFERQRVLVDVTHITDGDEQTGIQRVVRNIVRWLYCSNRAGFDVVAVRLESSGLKEATDWLRSQRLFPDHDESIARTAMRIGPRWGDILLMLDSSWAKIEAYLPIFEEIRRSFGKVYSVIYDLLPIRFPALFVEGGAAWFEGWLTKAIRHSDGLICISRSVADELEAFCASTGRKSPSRLGFWHLGCDLPQPAETKFTERVRRATSTRTLLMVGTVEPRKNHGLALDAMELLWAKGLDAGLCIAGKRGWMVDAFMTRLRNHAEFGRRLHFLEQPDDEELPHCYQRSTALLILSSGEGFGLPLVEAAQFGTPIIASDIAVFREVAGRNATYVTLGSAEQLADELEVWLERAARNEVPQSGAMPRLSWEQSAEALLDVVLENRWYKVDGEVAHK